MCVTWGLDAMQGGVLANYKYTPGVTRSGDPVACPQLLTTPGINTTGIPSANYVPFGA